MILNLFLLSTLTLASCEIAKKKTEPKEVESEKAIIVKQDSIDEKLPEVRSKLTKEVNDEFNTYFFENEEIFQSIKMKVLSKDTLSFEITSRSKASDNQSKYSGIALLAEGTEIDVDDKGKAYRIKEFLHEKDCWLAIRIDFKENDKLRIIEADCEHIRSTDCPFASV